MSSYPCGLTISAAPPAVAPIAIRRSYDPPSVIYETALEVRAGTPLDGALGLDLLNPE